MRGCSVGKKVSIKSAITILALFAIFVISGLNFFFSYKLFNEDKEAYLANGEKLRIESIRDQITNKLSSLYSEHRLLLYSDILNLPSTLSACALNKSSSINENIKICEPQMLETRENIILEYQGPKLVNVSEIHEFEDGGIVKINYIFNLNGSAPTDVVFSRNNIDQSDLTTTIKKGNLFISTIKLNHEILLSTSTTVDSSLIPNYIFNKLLLTIIISLSLVLLISIILAKLISYPIYRVTDFSRKLDTKNPEPYNPEETLLKEVDVLGVTLKGLTTNLINANSELKEKNENLEEIVRLRTMALEDLTAFQALILNSLNQALLVINQDGTCGDIFTDNCVTIFNEPPKGLYFSDLISKYKHSSNINIKSWISSLFNEDLFFEDLVSLGPKNCSKENGLFFKKIQLDYFKIEKDDTRAGVLVVITDLTELEIAENKAFQSERLLKRILLFLRDKNNFKIQSDHISILFKALLENEKITSKNLPILHTIKGSCGILGFEELQIKIHDIEGTIRDNHSVSKEMIDGLLNEFKKMLNEVISLASDEPSINDGFDLKNYLLSKNSYFEELALKYRKEVLIDWDITVGNGSHERLLGLIESSFHLVKNAIIHGIEEPEIRAGNGKEKIGKIKYKAIEEDGFLVIEILDDGKGINFEAIRSKYNSDLSKDEIISGIMTGEFSESSDTDLHRGRGKGVSAINDELSKLGGSLQCESSFGLGTTWLLTAPLECV